MNLKLQLRTKAERLSAGETDYSFHPFVHWLLVILATISTSAVFSLVGALLLFTGLIFLQAEISFWPILLGLPLTSVGVGIILINLYQILASILDRRYSKNHCPFCHPKEELDGYYRTC